MRYFMEMKTHRNDGALVIYRDQYPNVGLAWIAAQELATHFHDVKLVVCNDTQRIVHDCVNDLGEIVEIYAMAYGECAQVTQGVFIQ